MPLVQIDEQEYKRLVAIKANLESKYQPKVTKIQATEKGGVSVYGLQRYPVTLYPAAWKALFAQSTAIVGLIDAGLKSGKLSLTKPVKESTKASDSQLVVTL